MTELCIQTWWQLLGVGLALMAIATILYCVWDASREVIYVEVTEATEYDTELDNEIREALRVKSAM